VGSPIEVSEYMKNYAENPVNATNEIRDRLRNDLENLSFNLGSENYYHCFETATEVANKSVLTELQLTNNTINRFKARQKIAEKLIILEKSRPDEVGKLDLFCSEYTELLTELNLKSWVLDTNPSSILTLLLFGALEILTLPVFLIGFSLNAIPFLTPLLIRKYIIKPEFTGFISSLQFGLGMLTFPLFYILQTAFFGFFTNAAWWYILLFFFMQYPLGKMALKWYNKTTKYMAKWRYRTLVQKKSSKLFKVQTLHEQIIKMILNFE